MADVFIFVGIAVIFLGLIVEAVRVCKDRARDAGFSASGRPAGQHAGPADRVRWSRRARMPANGSTSCLGRQPEVGSRSQAAALIAAGAVTVDGRAAVQEPVCWRRAERVTVTLSERRRPLVVADRRGPRPVRRRVAAGGGQAGRDGRASFRSATPRGPWCRRSPGTDWRGERRSGPGWSTAWTRTRAGLLVVAKSVEAHRRLVAMMRRRAIDRALPGPRPRRFRGRQRAPSRLRWDGIRSGGSRWRWGGLRPGGAHALRGARALR